MKSDKEERESKKRFRSLRAGLHSEERQNWHQPPRSYTRD